MTGRQSRNGHASIEEVLQLIDAQPIPDADELAHLSIEEIERQLADLGVDSDAQISELLERIESPSVAPLASMSAQDLEQLSLARVEQQLEAEGVDVRGWLSRAETVIRNARSRGLMEQSSGGAPGRSSGSSRGGPSRGSRVGSLVHAPSRRGWRSRRLPQALVASIVMVAVGGVMFSILDQSEFDEGSSILAIEGFERAPVANELAREQSESRKRENAQLAQSSEAPAAIVPEVSASHQTPPVARFDAMQEDVLVAVKKAPHELATELRVMSPGIQREVPASPPVATAALPAEAEAQPAAQSSVVARLTSPSATQSAAPPAAARDAKPSLQSIEIDRLTLGPALVADAAGTDEQRYAAAAPRADAASRIVSTSTEAQFAARPEATIAAADGAAAPTAMFRAQEPSLKSLGTEQSMSRGALAAGVAQGDQVQRDGANPGAGIASHKRMRMAKSAASVDTARQEQVESASERVADRELAAVYEVRAGQTLAAVVDGLPLAKAEQEALTRVFSAVDLGRGAILRLSVSGKEVQAATLVLPQGRSVSAIRNARGGLVLER